VVFESFGAIFEVKAIGIETGNWFGPACQKRSALDFAIVCSKDVVKSVGDPRILLCPFHAYPQKSFLLIGRSFGAGDVVFDIHCS
jgi:hypothetical protein